MDLGFRLRADLFPLRFENPTAVVFLERRPALTELANSPDVL
jgi:hypothetical protein